MAEKALAVDRNALCDKLITPNPPPPPTSPPHPPTSHHPLTVVTAFRLRVAALSRVSCLVHTAHSPDSSSAYDYINGIANIAAVAGGSAADHNVNIFAINVSVCRALHVRASVCVCALHGHVVPCPLIACHITRATSRLNEYWRRGMFMRACARACVVLTGRFLS